MRVGVHHADICISELFHKLDAFEGVTCDFNHKVIGDLALYLKHNKESKRGW